jgi:16S rRNA (cytosine967-C5)-methyltransferase
LPTAQTARSVAWDILLRVETRGAWAEELLPERLQRAALSEPERRLCRELVFGAIKARRFLDFALEPLWKQARPPQPRVLTLLRLGAYQLLLLSKVPPHAAVHATVELAKSALTPAQAGFVNALLRELGRRGAPSLPDAAADPAAHLGVRYSFPDWLVRRWLDRYGDRAAALLDAANEAPPVVARVNRVRATREQARDRLRAAGITAEPLAAPTALRLTGAGDPARVPGFAEGWLYFQDESSQWLGHLTDPPADGTCLDLCAAPGGKATHLAELMDGRGRVVATDRHGGRLERVRQNAARLGLAGVEVHARLAPGLDADRVLVDAPCSGLGTLRRHAEGRWRVLSADLPRLAAAQLALLEQAAVRVRPGGHLVYATCTTEPEENEGVVAAFLERHPEFGLRPGPGSGGLPPAELWDADGMFRTFPGRGDGDGVFAARLELRTARGA